MKAVFTFLFALYLLALSVVPCGDVHASEALPVPAAFSVQVSHPPHTEDGCSPFCVCACCQTVVALTRVQPAIPAISIPLSAHCFADTYRSEKPAALSNAVWQPPKA